MACSDQENDFGLLIDKASYIDDGAVMHVGCRSSNSAMGSIGH